MANKFLDEKGLAHLWACVKKKIDNAISNLNGNITSIKNDISNLEKKIDANIIVLIGDSYGVGITANATVNGWAYYVKKSLSHKYKFYDYCTGGAGFVSASNILFLTQLKQAISDISDKNLVKQIIVCGGYNDRNADTVTLDNAIEKFVSLAETNFPKATIKIGMVGCSTNYENRNKLNNISLLMYSNAQYHRASYINNIEYWLSDWSMMSSDTIHPTQNGYILLASKIIGAIESGSTSCVDGYKSLRVTLNTSVFTALDTNNVMGGIIKMNNLTQWVFNRCNATFKSGVTIKGNEDILIGTIEQEINGMGAEMTAINFNAWIQLSASKFDSINGKLFIDGKKLYLKFVDVNAEGTAFKTFSSPVKINIYSAGGSFNSRFI